MNLRPSRWKRTTRWRVGLLVGFVLLVAGTRQAPYAIISPGITPDLMLAVTDSAGPGDRIDPSFGKGGRFLATTIEANPASYFKVGLCSAAESCDLYPLTDPGTGAGTEAAAMRASQENAAAAARALQGPAPAYPHAPTRAPLGRVQGSSAGLMLALALLDARTAGDLTGGKTVAGTGSLDPQGRVAPIAGVTHKVTGAAGAGATVFFSPAGQADAAAARARALPRPVTVVPVRTAADALAWLCEHGGSSTACPSPR